MNDHLILDASWAVSALAILADQAELTVEATTILFAAVVSALRCLGCWAARLATVGALAFVGQ